LLKELIQQRRASMSNKNIVLISKDECRRRFEPRSSSMTSQLWLEDYILGIWQQDEKLIKQGWIDDCTQKQEVKEMKKLDLEIKEVANGYSISDENNHNWATGTYTATSKKDLLEVVGKLVDQIKEDNKQIAKENTEIEAKKAKIDAAKKKSKAVDKELSDLIANS